MNSINNIKAATFTLLVSTSKEVNINIADITDDHYKDLDRDRLIALAKEFHTLLMDSMDLSDDINADITGADTSYFISKTKIKDLPFECNVPLIMDVIKVNNDKKDMEVIFNGSKVFRINVPRNTTWKDVTVQVGDSIEVIIKDVDSAVSPFKLVFLKYIENELDNEPEALETVSETHDMTDAIKDAQLVTDSHKKSYHAYKWSISDRFALYAAAAKGMPLTFIMMEGTNHGRQWTRKAYQTQLNEIGWSLKYGADSPMVKMPDHNSRWLAYQEKHKMNETYDDDE